MNESPLISIISPVYNAEKIVGTLVEEIRKHVQKITDRYEIILVEDCGPDNSWLEIKANCAKYPEVKGIRLSRNFGQHFAITAGLEASSGEYVVVMDCDMQHDPKYIPELYDLASQGNDIVYTRSIKRAHSFFKNITARLFYLVFNYLTDQPSGDLSGSSYTMLNREVVEAFCQINDVHRHYLLVLRWLGFDFAFLDIEHNKRLEGKSSYSLGKLISHAIDGITSQSDKILRLSIGLGFLFVVLSFAFVVFLIVRYFMIGALAGWTSTIAIILVSTGIILVAIGVLGIYIGKIFDQVKQRPLYLIRKKINF